MSKGVLPELLQTLKSPELMEDPYVGLNPIGDPVVTAVQQLEKLRDMKTFLKAYVTGMYRYETQEAIIEDGIIAAFLDRGQRKRLSTKRAVGHVLIKAMDRCPGQETFQRWVTAAENLGMWPLPEEKTYEFHIDDDI